MKGNYLLSKEYQDNKETKQGISRQRKETK